MVKEKINIISAGKLDNAGLKKLGKSLVISLAGALIVFLGDITNIVNFGGFGAMAATMIPFGVNFLRKWLLSYETKA